MAPGVPRKSKKNVGSSELDGLKNAGSKAKFHLE